ncbi:exosortase N [Chitinophaga sp. YR627]|uniref:exosortase N n=1 Tax=Chitinophaga sp. YR627 TaxID=1881041 RepID=UPI0008E90405|nr:exosortase N [Chitinophaga sp. YR627]SFM68554.1 exosortase N [Chitinophaga sp. YR627]
MAKHFYQILLKMIYAGRCWPVLLFGCYGFILFYGLRAYHDWSSVSSILGVVVLLTVTSFKRSEKGGIRFFLLALLPLLLYLLAPAKTLLWAAAVCGCLFLAETFYGRINHLPLMVLGIITPLFKSVTDVFSFPIRLVLTKCAGTVLSRMGGGTRVEGNMIVMNGAEFSVDPACMGLQMTITSLLCAIMIIGFYQKKYQKVLSARMVFGALLLVMVLNIGSNLLRIILLVWFHIMPDTVLHDVAGILCLLVYVIAPALFLLRWGGNRYGYPEQTHRRRYVLRSALKMSLLNVSLAGVILLALVFRSFIATENAGTQQAAGIPGFAVATLPGDIIRLQNDRLLVYIKHIPNGYYSEHHPMICWKGSGYNFYRVQETPVDGHRIYTARLQQEKDVLYTAWWYDNGVVTTNSQLQWRWDALLGAHPYSLVNVTAASERELQLAVKDLLEKHRLSTYL